MARGTTLHPYLDRGVGRLALAHRGGAHERIENSWAAFRHAADCGLRYIETDVRASADGVLVIHHDATLDRVTDSSGLIQARPWADIRSAVVDGEPIPRLDEALEAFPEMAFNVDCKDDQTLVPLMRFLRALRPSDLERLCIGSFSQRRLDELRNVFGPRLATSCGPRDVLALKAACAGLPVPVPPPSVIAAQVPMSIRTIPVLSPAFVDIAHRRGQQVHVWVINDEHAMRCLYDMGVDGIVTDRPSIVREVLRSRAA